MVESDVELLSGNRRDIFVAGSRLLQNVGFLSRYSITTNKFLKEIESARSDEPSEPVISFTSVPKILDKRFSGSVDGTDTRSNSEHGDDTCSITELNISSNGAEDSEWEIAYDHYRC